jgi:hypothetical protein
MVLNGPPSAQSFTQDHFVSEIIRQLRWKNADFSAIILR